MHITALDAIAPHARYKVWVKSNGEMPFLYGGNIVKGKPICTMYWKRN
jgi:60S ribosome subunit biogenesis protein NIP7